MDQKTLGYEGYFMRNVDQKDRYMFWPLGPIFLICKEKMGGQKSATGGFIAPELILYISLEVAPTLKRSIMYQNIDVYALAVQFCFPGL